LLHGIILQDHIPDRWRWSLDPINGYSIKGTYRFLTTADAPPEHGLSVDVWLKQVPLKVSLFAWRLFCNMLPTKYNLVRRHILHTGDNICVGGCGTQETADHLLFGCVPFSNVWYAVLKWLHLSFVTPFRSRNHFHQFGQMAGLPRSSHTFFQIIWMAFV